MHRSFSRWMVLSLCLGSLGVGCAAPSVGDPCQPESVPEGGFVPTEAYLETSSVQCETRVCMVYKLDGDPRPGCAPPARCPPESDVRDRVYCTCRCRAPGDSNARTCDCPDGYQCENILMLGGPGVQGGYCVKSSTVTPT